MNTASELFRRFRFGLLFFSVIAAALVTAPNTAPAQCYGDCYNEGGQRGGGDQGNKPNWGAIGGQILNNLIQQQQKQQQDAWRRKQQQDAWRRKQDALRRAKAARDAARRKAERDAARRRKAQRDAAERRRKAEADEKRRNAEAASQKQKDGGQQATDVDKTETGGDSPVGSVVTTALNGVPLDVIVGSFGDLPDPAGLPDSICAIKIGKISIFCGGYLKDPPGSCSGRLENGCYLRRVDVPKAGGEGESAAVCMQFCETRPPPVVVTLPPPNKPSKSSVDFTEPNPPSYKPPKYKPPEPPPKKPTGSPAVSTGIASLYREPERPKKPAVETGTATSYLEPAPPPRPAFATVVAATYVQPEQPATPAVKTVTAAPVHYVIPKKVYRWWCKRLKQRQCRGQYYRRISYLRCKHRFKKILRAKGVNRPPGWFRRECNRQVRKCERRPPCAKLTRS